MNAEKYYPTGHTLSQTGSLAHQVSQWGKHNPQRGFQCLAAPPPHQSDPKKMKRASKKEVGHEEEVERLGSQPLLDLGRQQRNLLLMRPLFQLDSNKTRYPELEGVDTNYLVLSLLDYLMEGTTVGLGRRPEDTTVFLAEVLHTMRSELPAKGCQRGARVVLDHIKNDGELFRCDYYDGRTRENAVLKFRLIDVDADAEDNWYYKPTHHGYLVYLGMLDLAPEDAEELMNKMLDLLVQRGRFEEAREIAQRARKASIENSQRIRDILSRANRAPASVHWTKDVAPHLDTARDHVRARQVEDQRMLDAVRAKVPGADDTARPSIIAVLDEISAASVVRTNLQGDITKAPEQFSQSNIGAFRARRRTGLPDLDAQLLPQLMQLACGELAEFADQEFSCLLGWQFPRIYDLDSVFSALLDAHDQDEPPDDEDGDIESMVEILPEFSDETLARVKDWVGRAIKGDTPVTMEALYQQAEAYGFDSTAKRCLYFYLNQAYAPSEGLLTEVRVTAKGRFENDIVEGSNLVFSPMKDRSHG